MRAGTLEIGAAAAPVCHSRGLTCRWILAEIREPGCADGTVRTGFVKGKHMKFYSQERVALFIDGANLYATARSLGFDIDYKRLLNIFSDQCNLIRSLYYTALVEDQEYSPIRPLVDWLDYNGYTMVTKPTKEFTDATGRRKVKGNMDIELAVDVMEMLEYLDHIILFSGDGDFRRLVEEVERRGRRVPVVPTLRSHHPKTS